MFLTKYNKPTYQFGRVSYSPLFVFDTLFNQSFDRLATSYESRLNLNETDSQYTLSIELPGFDQKDVEVTVDDGVLRIKAENKDKETSRALNLWEGINFEKVSGSMKNGLLTVVLPKIEKIKPRKIEIG